MPGHHIITIGASAGGVEALQKLISSLPCDIPAAIFVVLHIPANVPSVLPTLLNRVSCLPVSHAVDRQAIEIGNIYVAPPDHHMLVEEGYMRVVQGPKENRARPAVDPLLRSAARSYGARVVGVVLTGSLDDGTAGLMAVYRSGGITVVQDPNDALYESMPRSAMEHVPIDYCVPLKEIGPLLARLATEPTQEKRQLPVSKEMDQELKVVEIDPSTLDTQEHPGTPSPFSCPECGGVLWELNDGNLLRFRCRVGHAFSSESMLAEQNDALEHALWVALKTLEEQASLAHRMADRARANGHTASAMRFDEREHDAAQNALLIRGVLLSDVT